MSPLRLINYTTEVYTVESRYVELGYVEVCESRSVYLNHKNNFDWFLQPYFGVGDILQVQLPEVQINLHLG